MTDHAYGIDLGTTYSAIAYVDANDTVEVAENQEGQPTTPSVIYFESDSNTVVGVEAKNGAVTAPDDTCTLIKRKMGTEYEVEYQGQSFKPEELSALILKELVQTANAFTGFDTNKVVITVPEYFGQQEREATRQAGQIAGLDVLSIVAEPVAAGTSLGLKNLGDDDAEKMLTVYDLGGGTFDTTVMAVQRGNIRVIETGGDRLLGGADWDKALIDLLVEKLAEAAGADALDLRMEEDFMAELALKAEDTKKSLTRRESVQVRMHVAGERVSAEVSRDEFETATASLLQSTISLSRDTIERAKQKEPGLEVEKVLLVGGSSRMPQVRKAIESELGYECQDTEFDLSVAKGAAILAKAIIDGVVDDSEREVTGDTSEQRLYLGGAQSLRIQNVLGRGVGIEFYDPEKDEHHISFVAHTSDQIPSEQEPIDAQTVADNQTTTQIKVYEQAGDTESRDPANNRLLKEMSLDLGGPVPKGSPIEIHTRISAEGVIFVHARDPKSGNENSMEATVSLMSAEDVEKATAKVSAIAVRG